MPTLKAMKRAELAEYAILHYEAFMHKVLINNTYNIALKTRILIYCYFHRAGSLKQFLTLFDDNGEHTSAVNMALSRLKNDGHLVSFSSEESIETGYRISANGIRYIQDKLIPLYYSVYPSMDETQYTVSDIVTFIGERHELPLPTYYSHYFGIRDFNACLLTHPFVSSDYSYITEIGIEEGKPFSLYSQFLNGFYRKKTEIRADGCLTYHMPTYPTIETTIYVEQDTGTQRGGILREKVYHYLSSLTTVIDHFDKDCFPPSLLFSFKGLNNRRKKPLPVKGAYSKKAIIDLTNAICICNTMNCLGAYLPQELCSSAPTLNQCIAYLEALSKLTNFSPDLKLLLENMLVLRNEEKGELPLAIIRSNLLSQKEQASQTKVDVMDEYYAKYYVSRKQVMVKEIECIDGIKTACLKGLSIYTLSNERMRYTVSYLIPEMFQFSSRLKRQLISYGAIRQQEQVFFSPFMKQEREQDSSSLPYLFRNHYTFEHGLHCLIENVSDDYGGYVRLLSFLAAERGQWTPNNYKLICLCDDSFFDTHSDDILSTELGKYLALNASSEWDNEPFELLFTTYRDIELGNYFALSMDGSRIYKHHVV